MGLYIVGLGSAAFMAPGSQVASSKVVRASSADMGLRSTIKGLFNKKQDFLEADPYWETKDIPINTFKNKAPFTSKVVSTKRVPQHHPPSVRREDAVRRGVQGPGM